jgi:ATP-binding cassette subfamily C protein LapB
MQVYDRVIPAQSYPTLYVLTIGVLIATLFGFVLRLARGHIMDLLGKRADLRVSDRVFGHALRLRNSAVPRSTGSFISQLRELEQIREMVTSSTISTIVDLPFFLLFVVVLAIIAPQLAWIAPSLPWLWYFQVCCCRQNWPRWRSSLPMSPPCATRCW